MTGISAVMRAANCTAFDYPLAASVRSALTVADEVCIAVGQSVDDTLAVVDGLQHEYGAGRVKFTVADWRYDRGWQERAWHQAVAMADFDWLLLLDADEAIHEQDAATIQDAILEPGALLVRFPMLHFWGTPDTYQTPSPHWYKKHTRLGRKSALFMMANLRTATNTAPVCDMLAVVGDKLVHAHIYAGREIVDLDAPIYHYGWVRNAQAMSSKTARFVDWYADGPQYTAGVIPDVPPYDFDASNQALVPFTGTHPAVMADWFAAHEAEWQTRRAGMVASSVS